MSDDEQLYPSIATRLDVILPGVVTSIEIGRERSAGAIEAALDEHSRVEAHVAADEMGISLHTIRSYIKEGYRILEAYDETEYPVDMSPQERAFLESRARVSADQSRWFRNSSVFECMAERWTRLCCICNMILSMALGRAGA